MSLSAVRGGLGPLAHQEIASIRRHVCAPRWRGGMRGIVAGLILAGTGAWAAEPTEQEMRAAVQLQFDNVNGASAETAERCNNREFNRGGGNPLLAMECLGQAFGGGMTRDGRNVTPMTVSITNFHKIACEKAQGKAGYLCDYAMGYDTNSPNNVAGPYTRQPTVMQGRFVKRGARWIRLEE